MYAIVLELIARLSFTVMAIVNKRSRGNGVSALGVMGQLSWGLPLFAALGIGLFIYDRAAFHLDATYFLWLAGWGVVCAIVNFIIFFLSRYQALIEMGGYKLGFTMVVSVAIDMIAYNEQFSWLYVVGGALAVGGGVLLSTRTKTTEEKAHSVDRPFPIWIVVALGLVVAGLAPVIFWLYKECLAMAVHQPLLHTVFSQGMLFTLFFVIGKRDYDAARQSGQLPAWSVATVVGCVTLAAIVQTWSLAALSVTTIMVLGLLTAALCLAHDIWTKEVALTRRNLASIGLVLLGSAIIGASKL